MRDVLKAVGFSGLFVVGCVISAFIAVAFTLGFAKDGPEGEQGPRGKPGVVGPRGYPGDSESGENAEAQVINMEGEVSGLRSRLEEDEGFIKELSDNEAETARITANICSEVEELFC